MTDKEYFDRIATALLAVAEGCAKYMQKNPNAKYKDIDGVERPISFALDITRKHAKVLQEVTTDEQNV